MLIESKQSESGYEEKAKNMLAFSACIVGLIVSGAILWVHGNPHLLLSYTAVPPQAQVSGAVDTILKASAERRSLLLELKAALISKQEKLALSLARKYCGIEGRNGD